MIFSMQWASSGKNVLSHGVIWIKQNEFTLLLAYQDLWPGIIFSYSTSREFNSGRVICCLYARTVKVFDPSKDDKLELSKIENT